MLHDIYKKLLWCGHIWFDPVSTSCDVVEDFIAHVEWCCW